MSEPQGIQIRPYPISRSALKRRSRRALRRATPLIVAIGCICGSAASLTPPRPLANFSTAKGDLPSGWETMRFAKTERSTRYGLTIDPATGDSVVLAVADDSAGGLIHRTAIDLETTPLLRWRWKIDHVLEHGDARTQGGDDYPARVYLTFEPDRDSMTLFERAKWLLARAVYGDVPGRAINYIWANRLPKGESVDSAYVGGFVKLLAVESGDEYAGQWRTVERDVASDYRTLFGGAPPPVAGVALMTDTDDTGEKVRAWYGDIEFRARATSE